MLEHKPHHVRRKIAFVCTFAVAAVLVAVLVLHYTHKKAPATDETSSRFKDFYNTLSNTSQSFFGQK